MQKPYPHRGLSKEERIFNYRLSRARRVVENAFDILANRFRVLLSSIQLHPRNVESVVLACCVLHNLIRIRSPDQVQNEADVEDPVTHVVTPANWREGARLPDLPTLSAGNHNTQAGKAIRDYLKRYYSSPQGRVHWQDTMV